MPSLNISLPAPLREWIEAQVKGGRYGNASEYLRELIRRDQERQAQERLERLLLDGIESGKASPLTKKDWAELRSEVAERLEKRRGGRAKKSAGQGPQGPVRPRAGAEVEIRVAWGTCRGRIGRLRSSGSGGRC